MQPPLLLATLQAPAPTQRPHTRGIHATQQLPTRHRKCSTHLASRVVVLEGAEGGDQAGGHLEQGTVGGIMARVMRLLSQQYHWSRDVRPLIPNFPILNQEITAPELTSTSQSPPVLPTYLERNSFRK